MIQRLCKLSKTNSFFLFGPRGVGKSTLLEGSFQTKDTLFIDLLDPETLDEFLMDIGRFRALIDSEKNKNKRVIIDEIQKLPQLLDLVHQQIQKKKRQFVLTGSSSRRLKQAGTNLLAGRAWTFHLYPFSAQELGKDFDLKKALEIGTLPDAYLAPDFESAREYLTSYVSTYLEKEIQQERWVRRLEPFRKFLAIAAQMNGRTLNYSTIARECGIDDVTAANYFEILQDTMLGYLLPAYHPSVREAQKQASKFYFIDSGMKRALDRTLRVELLPQTVAWGEAFESFFIGEIVKSISYRRLDWSLSYLRTKDDQEIDLIIDRPGAKKFLVEIKSKTKVHEADAKTLLHLGVDLDPDAEKILISMDPLPQTFGDVRSLHWAEALKVWFGEST